MAFCMNVDELIKDTDYFVSAATVAHVLRVAPQGLRECCKNKPETIGFPFSYVGNHLIIPRIPFLRWIGIPDKLIFDEERTTHDS